MLVKCFEVDDEAEVVVVFAHTSDHARELFDEWNRLAYGDGGKNATVEEDVTLAAERASGDAQRRHGRAAAEVGSVCENGFWRIFPADYEPTYVWPSESPR